MHAMGVCIVVDRELLIEGRVCDDDDLEAGQELRRELLRLEDVDGDVSIEFAEPVEGGLVSGLANVAFAEEELGS